MLSFRQLDHEAVEGVGQRDLAGESRIVRALRHAVEHFLLGRRARSYPGAPMRINIDMASRAGAIAPTISIDARHTVIGGCAHQRCAGGNFNGAAFAFKRNKGYFRHIYQLVIDAISKRFNIGRIPSTKSRTPVSEVKRIAG